MVHICEFYIQNNVQEAIYEYTLVKYLDNSNHLLYQRVFSIQIVISQWTILKYYWLIYNYMWTKVHYEYLIVEEYILQSFEKWETITFNKISQKRDILIKTLYEVYM